MMAGITLIQISTYKGQGLYTSGRTPGGVQITVNVTEDDPWDKLSKVFKKYKHTITYPTGDVRYNASDYTISVYRQGGSGFTLNRPSPQVNKVEFFFKGNDTDINSKTPLVVGFVYASSIGGCGSTCYYTWSVLTSTNRGNYSGTITAKSVTKNELITGLLEELGNTGGVSNRKNKLVIRLGVQSTSGPHNKYPGTGYYKNSNKQITVTNASGTGVASVVGYVHTVAKGVSESEFYVSYNNDSRYFMIGSEVGVGSGRAYIDKVTGYFETGGGTHRLVFITFSFKDGSSSSSIGDKLYGYSYQDFVNDLKKVKSATVATADGTVKTIKELDAISGVTGGLQKKLQGEIERLKEFIEFKKGGLGGDENNENIKTSELHNFGNDTAGQGYKFKKVEMTPISNDKDVPDNRSVGPWSVFSTKLFNDNTGTTIDSSAKIQDSDGVLDGITTGDVTASGSSKKYSSITVYYGTKSCRTDNYNDYKALLLEFVPGRGSSGKKYIKRVKGSTTWEDASTDIGGNDVDADKLTEIAKKAGIIEDRKPSPSPADVSSQVSQKDMSTGTKAGIGTGVTAIFGAGAGFAIYKYHGVFLSLIGR